MALCALSIIWDPILPSFKQHVYRMEKEQKSSAKMRGLFDIWCVIITRPLSRCAKSSCMSASRWIAGASGSGTARRVSTNILRATRIAIDAAQVTNPDAWRMQAVSNRQGSEGFLELEKGKIFSARERELHELARMVYNERIDAGLAREQARKDLPLSTYTEAYWKTDLHNLLHFLELRMEQHAQLEIRSYATTIGNEIVSKWCPMVWEAFKDYQFGAMELSKQEIEIIARLQAGDGDGARSLAVHFGLLPPVGEKLKFNLERSEFEQKLEVLGIRPPWLES